MRSDYFSIGCIMAEMIVQSPLFPRIHEGPKYKHEKTLMFDSKLGNYPRVLMEQVRDQFPGIFPHGINTDVSPIIPMVMSRVVKDYLLSDSSLYVRIIYFGMSINIESHGRTRFKMRRPTKYLNFYSNCYLRREVI